ncbi:MAG: hypothetical protein ISP71_06420 [Flavobacteriales bacterium]|nr:hypothetical protein [Flavobacteriales bacterium]
MNSLTAPMNGSLLFNQEINSTFLYDGYEWVDLMDSWSVGGNQNTQSQHFIGTTDNQDLMLKTNDTVRLVITKDGDVGVGTNQPSGKLQVKMETYLQDMSSNPTNGVTVSLLSLTPGFWTTPINSESRAFDNNPETFFEYGLGGLSSNQYTSHAAIILDLNTLTPPVIGRYGVLCHTNSFQGWYSYPTSNDYWMCPVPRRFHLQGSHDATNWVDLSPEVERSPFDYINENLQTFDIDNDVAYRYIRLRITRHVAYFDVGGSIEGTNRISELKLYAKIEDNGFVVKNSGNTAIGTQTPTERLHVNGNIIANSALTPDYVFEKHYEGKSKSNPEYELISLEDVEIYVEEHHHLPNVPSAHDVKKQGGIILNQATEKNLEKIEELYLHFFEMKKEINQLKSEIEQIKK